MTILWLQSSLDHLSLFSVLPQHNRSAKNRSKDLNQAQGKPDHEVGKLLLRLNGDADPAVHLLAVLRRRPILNAPGKKLWSGSINNQQAHMTRMKSNVLVTMTMQEAFSCQTIRQKSGIVDSVGPWVTMYAFGCTRLWVGNRGSSVCLDECPWKGKILFSNLNSKWQELLAYIDIRGVDVVAVRNSLLRLQNHPVEVICRQVGKVNKICEAHMEWFVDSGSSRCWTSWRHVSGSACCSPSQRCWTRPEGGVFKLSIAFFPFHLDESDDCWTLAAVMHSAVKLAKACSCESQLSTELLQDESDRQAVANFKDFLSVLVGQWTSPSTLSMK